MTDSSIHIEAPGWLDLIRRNVMECLTLCVVPAACLCWGPLKSVSLSQHCFYAAQLSLGISCLAIKSSQPIQTREASLQKLLCGLTSKHWHSSRDAAKLINLVPPHLEPRHKGSHSLKLELKVCLSQKCPPAPPGICVAVRLEEWQHSSSW